MAATATLDKTELQAMFVKIQAASPLLAKSCQHLASAMRADFEKLRVAVESGDPVSIASIAGSIRSSALVTGIATTIGDARKQADELVEDLRPWAKLILGLTIVVGGAVLWNTTWAAVAAILMIGGFAIALIGIADVAKRKGLL